MSIYRFTLISITLLCLGFLLSDCKKSNNEKEEDPKSADKTSPVITLKGEKDMEIGLGTATSDPGATASDDTDGDLSASVTSDWNSKVNTNVPGMYTVTYAVSDKSGNQASTTRKVAVKLGAASCLGEYTTIVYSAGVQAGSAFTSTISATGNKNQFRLYPFYGANPTLDVNVGGLLGDELSFSQSGSGLTVQGEGKIENSGQKITLTYTIYSGSTQYPTSEVLTRK